VTVDERKDIIERGAKRIRRDWPEFSNWEIALIIFEALWEEFAAEKTN
jgi:hypothetical protein